MATTPQAQERSAPSARPQPEAARQRWRLTRGVRRATLVVHIIAAGAWMGIDVIVGLLVLVGWFGDDPAVRGVAYQALSLFVVWPMFTAGLTCLVSGLVLGMGTPWGLVRYWWAAVKLALNLVLSTLVIVALRPIMADVRAYGQDLSAGTPTDGSVSLLFYPPAVSLTALSFATVLAVFKPWGRIRSSRDAGR